MGGLDPLSASGLLTRPLGWVLGDQYGTVWGGGGFFFSQKRSIPTVPWGGGG